MRFRPCIDIHNGRVKQIVGGSLSDEGNQAKENFVSEKQADFYATLYKEQGLKGGHIILLNAKDSEYYEDTKKQAVKALRAVSEWLADRRRNYGRECERISGGRSKSCDCYFLCF